ncbi:MAG: EAL domain-containing protein [Methylococcaceae bacterium]
MFILIFYIGWHLIDRYESDLLAEQRIELKKELTKRASVLVKEANYRFSLLHDVRSFVNKNIDLYYSDPQKFEQKANDFLKTIHKKVPDVKSIVIAPLGIQRYIFPDTEVNLNSLGQNLLARTLTEKKEETGGNNQSKTVGVSNPFYLINNNKLGTVARLAIYPNGSFWGLTSITLDIMPMLIKANLVNSKNELFQFALRVKGASVFYGEASSFNINSVVHKLHMPDSQWEIAITPLVINRFNIKLWFAINLFLALLGGALLYYFLIWKKNIELSVSKKVASITQEKHDLASVLIALPDLYFRTTRDGTILDYQINQPGKFHITSEQCKSLKIQDVLPREFGYIFVEKIEQFCLTRQLQTFEYTLQQSTGNYDFEVRLTGILGSEDFLVIIREVTEQKKSEALIWYQANYDPLTKLPNRRMLQDRLDQEISKSRRTGQTLALLFLDLDRFKNVNDRLGHEMGDLLLVEAAKRISSCLRDSDTVARFGGDEFTIILSELEDLHSIERIAQHIITVLSQQFILDDNTANISASIGISIYPDDAKNADRLLKNADQAMYSAKALGRSRFSYFTKSLQQAAQFRFILLNDMHKAITENQFQLYFQPIVDLTTNEIYKAEVLLRWNHPKVGLVKPDTFLSLAEETGLIVDIGNWVCEQSIKHIKRFKNKHKIEIQLSINKSSVQFQAMAQNEKWIQYLQQLELSGDSIMIEINESLLMEADSNIDKQLIKFREQGIQVALDDFGAGYSSLSSLKYFEIDVIKLDHKFIRNLTPDSDDMAFSEAIITMAHKLGLKVIAEGIETEQQKELLIKAGCDYGQGYLISKPLPADKLIKFLQKTEKQVII